MLCGICEYAFLPMRIGMSHRTEMVNQVLFGERFEVLIKHKDWSRIRLFHDNYEGWVETDTITFSGDIVEPNYYEQQLVVSSSRAKLQKNETLQLHVPKGSLLPLDNRKFSIGSNNYSVLDDVSGINRASVRERVLQIANELLETPYLWGGRSQWGIDCSGFVQLVFRIAGKFLPRDASEQSKIGQTLYFNAEAQPGDLAFFDNEEGIITHVGIICAENKIIHASKKVRIDNIDHHGIFNAELKKYTHTLRVLKNII